MYSIRLLDSSVQDSMAWLVWVVLAIFFLMVFLGWLVASKGWLKREAEIAQTDPEHEKHVETDGTPKA